MTDPTLLDAVIRDLKSIGVPAEAPGWIFQRVTLHKAGIRLARVETVRDLGLTQTTTILPFDWTDAERGYRLEMLALDARSAPFAVPEAVRTTDVDGNPLAIIRARVVPPRGRIFARLDWWPMGSEPAYSYGGVNPAGSRGDNDTSNAHGGFTLLGRFRQPQGGPTAMTDKEAFDEAVKYGGEWLDNNPDEPIRALKSKHLAARKCVEPKSYDQWMYEHHFGIKTVREKLRELRGEK